MLPRHSICMGFLHDHTLMVEVPAGFTHLLLVFSGKKTATRNSIIQYVKYSVILFHRIADKPATVLEGQNLLNLCAFVVVCLNLCILQEKPRWGSVSFVTNATPKKTRGQGKRAKTGKRATAAATNMTT